MLNLRFRHFMNIILYIFTWKSIIELFLYDYNNKLLSLKYEYYSFNWKSVFVFATNFSESYYYAHLCYDVLFLRITHLFAFFSVLTQYIGETILFPSASLTICNKQCISFHILTFNEINSWVLPSSWAQSSNFPVHELQEISHVTAKYVHITISLINFT